jgi:hypothetical protein
MSVDLQLTILVYMGRHGLPKAVGKDLLSNVLRSDLDELRYTTPRDWIGVLAWLRSIDDDKLEERLRQCFTAGWYEMQF